MFTPEEIAPCTIHQIDSLTEGFLRKYQLI